MLDNSLVRGGELLEVLEQNAGKEKVEISNKTAARVSEKTPPHPLALLAESGEAASTQVNP